MLTGVLEGSTMYEPLVILLRVAPHFNESHASSGAGAQAAVPIVTIMWHTYFM